MANDAWAADLFDKVSSEVRSYHDINEVRRTRAFERVEALDRSDQAAFVVYCLHRTADLGRDADEVDAGPHWDKDWPEKQRRLYVWWAAVSCAHALLRRSLPWTDEQLGALVAHFEAPVQRSGIDHLEKGLANQLEANADRVRANKELHDRLSGFVQDPGERRNSDSYKVQHRLAKLVGLESFTAVSSGEAWADRALADLEALSQTKRAAWNDVLEHAATAGGSKPSAKWTKAANALCKTLDSKAFARQICTWFDLVDKPRTVEQRREFEWSPDPAHLIGEANADILKGLCWIASTIPDPDLARALGRLALSCYRKVPGIGPRAVKIGNAAVYALGQMPGRDALGQLALLRVKVKFATAQKLLDKALTTAAEREGLPREEIEELAVPAYGLTEVGLRRETLGDYTAELRLRGMAKPVLGFIKPDGKPQKSVPAAIKETHADDIKELKAAAKDIGAMLPAQRDRIDGLFLEDKSWDLSTWRERYLDHPLVGVIARRLIWRFASGKEGVWDADARAVAAIWQGDTLVGLDAEPIALDDSTRVRLWHPIEVERSEIIAWREFLESREIVQPFKQAHREVYLLTDAERATSVYSNRYAAHILRQHQFNALCAARRWKNKLRLMVDDEYPPALRTLGAYDLRAEFWIEGAGDEYGTDTNEAGVFNHLVTDQVRFYRQDAALSTAHAWGGRYGTYGQLGTNDDPLPLDSLPPLVLSEIMRDVDLFVGVTSVGNNPAWQDGGPEGEHRDYWWSYSFGDLTATAETRRDILSRLIPRLKIADRCTLDGKFLTVRGDIRAYKIHLGSANILMEPNDEYLCIVPGRADPKSPQKLYLPFEGDRTLAVVLSKAFLLAEDAKITDDTITSQIREP